MIRLKQRIQLRGLAMAFALGMTAALVAAPGWSASVEDLADEITYERLESRIEQMAELGSRVSGYPGNQQAAEIILETFDQLGMETHVQEFDQPIPLEHSASLAVDGEIYDISGLWPNLVRTSAVPSEGITGPIIDAGEGRLSDFDYKPVEQAIVLMDFNTGQNWLHAPLLDAGSPLLADTTPSQSAPDACSEHPPDTQGSVSKPLADDANGLDVDGASSYGVLRRSAYGAPSVASLLASRQRMSAGSQPVYLATARLRL